MNEIEAIERAIEWFEKQNAYYSEKETYQEDFRMNGLALAALREQAEREKGCEYCATDVMDGNPIIHKHASGYIGNGKFSSAGSCKTRFCPMCGKRLEEHHE